MNQPSKAPPPPSYRERPAPASLVLSAEAALGACPLSAYLCWKADTCLSLTPSLTPAADCRYLPLHIPHPPLTPLLALGISCFLSRLLSLPIHFIYFIVLSLFPSSPPTHALSSLPFPALWPFLFFFSSKYIFHLSLRPRNPGPERGQFRAVVRVGARE